MSSVSTPAPLSIPQAAEQLAQVQEAGQRVFRGKPQVIRLALTALFARGHVLIEDLPGLGKTTLARALARLLGCEFRRIQFTADLLPSDILGVSVYNWDTKGFEFKPGPIFTNVLLADEVNRSSPRTQSSLLEAMNEATVSVDNQTHRLPRPFLVLATQNPLEHYGTFPLPDSQLDRFLLRVTIGYPEREEEKAIIATQAAGDPLGTLAPLLNPARVLALQETVERVRLEASLLEYLMVLVERTRSHPRLAVGASPRGAIALHRAAQALALLEGRDFCLPDDVKRLAVPVLAHRLIPRGGQEEGSAVGEECVRELLDQVPVPA